MIAINCNHLSKSFITVPILEDIQFSVDRRDKIGVIGVNGCGKTTLFNILAGELTPDQGDLFIPKDMKIGYLHQEIHSDSDKTVYQYCVEVFQFLLDIEDKIHQLEAEMARMTKEESKANSQILQQYALLNEEFIERNGFGYHSAIHGVLKGLGFVETEYELPVKCLSGGQKSRLNLAKLMLEKPDVLLLDEPTNHLDLQAIEYLENFLRDYSGAVLLISHDRFFLDAIVNRIFHLEHAKLHVYQTNYTQFIMQRKKQLSYQIRTYENQQKEIQKQSEIVQRFANYGNSRLVRQSQSRKRMLDKINIIGDPLPSKKKMGLVFKPALESGKDVMFVNNVSKTFGKKQLFQNVDFQCYKRDCLGLIGANGVGKTTLLKMILGLESCTEGEIKVGHNVVIGYFDQEQQNLHDNKTILEEIWDAHPELSHLDVRSYLARFLFIGDDLDKKIYELSGGEKSRISLLKLMLSNANFLLLDEPTNHLDIDSKEILEDALMHYDGTILVISHDRYFLNKVTDKLLVLDQSGATTYIGNYDYYLEKIRQEKSEEQIIEKTRTQTIKEKKKTRDLHNAIIQRRREIKQLEERIARLEDIWKKFQCDCQDPSLYEDGQKTKDFFQKMKQLELEKASAYERWIFLSEESNDG